MLFFSLRFGKKQRVFLVTALCGAAILLAGWGIAGVFHSRLLQQDEAVPASAPAEAAGEDASVNEGRLAFLRGLGHQADPEPEEVVDVLIPEVFDTAYENYNSLQKQQGYDLGKYKGKKVKRYRYKILNYPEKDVPASATLLVYKGEVIGGDITLGGESAKVRSLSLPDGT